jgi:uncharacterized UPF0160 family protein
MKTIITHDGRFHSDEILAIALAIEFNYLGTATNKYIIKRIPNDDSLIDDNFIGTDLVVDIGMRFDNRKFFDHHQNNSGIASAGLMWNSILMKDKIERNRYPEIDNLVKLSDQHDIGDCKASPTEYPSLIALINRKDTSIDSDQCDGFITALDFTIDIIHSIRTNVSIDTIEYIKKCERVDGFPMVLDVKKHINNISSIVNGKTYKDVELIIWQKKNGDYGLKVPNKDIGTFDLNGRKLKDKSYMSFVHPNGFYAVAKNINDLNRFLSDTYVEEP